jgi:MraZ protein
MLIGKYYHKLEAQNRLSLPKKFRDDSESWIITRGLDGCLFLFKPADFTAQLQLITERSLTKKTNRDLIRLMANEATEVSPDQNGRIHLPEYLTEFAHLTESVVVVGSLERIELWDQSTYHAYIEQIESNAETIAETVETS